MVGVLAVVLVLCIGGGAAAYFFVIADDEPSDGPDKPVAVASSPAVASAPASAQATTKPSASRPAGGEEEVSGDLSGYQQGECLTVDESDDNRVDEAKCTDPGAYKVLLRKNGTLDDSICDTTDATFSLSQDGPGPTRDFVLCMGPVD